MKVLLKLTIAFLIISSSISGEPTADHVRTMLSTENLKSQEIQANTPLLILLAFGKQLKQLKFSSMPMKDSKMIHPSKI